METSFNRKLLPTRLAINSLRVDKLRGPIIEKLVRSGTHRRGSGRENAFGGLNGIQTPRTKFLGPRILRGMVSKKLQRSNGIICHGNSMGLILGDAGDRQGNQTRGQSSTPMLTLGRRESTKVTLPSLFSSRPVQPLATTHRNGITIFEDFQLGELFEDTSHEKQHDVRPAQRPSAKDEEIDQWKEDHKENSNQPGTNTT